MPEPSETRVITLNDPLKNAAAKFLHNSISTTKYNLLTFLPKFLFAQFRIVGSLVQLSNAVYYLLPACRISILSL